MCIWKTRVAHLKIWLGNSAAFVKLLAGSESAQELFGDFQLTGVRRAEKGQQPGLSF
jgi:hypothetical protein